MGFHTSRYTGFRRWLKGRKLRGQWYIIAAVLFSFSLLTFFDIFNSYSQMDYTSVAQKDEDVIFYNVLQNLGEISDQSGNATMGDDVADYMHMVKECMMARGVFIGYDISASNSTNLTNLEVSGQNFRVLGVN